MHGTPRRGSVPAGRIGESVSLIILSILSILVSDVCYSRPYLSRRDQSKGISLSHAGARSSSGSALDRTRDGTFITMHSVSEMHL